jgi:hypothetical protein
VFPIHTEKVLAYSCHDKVSKDILVGERVAPRDAHILIPRTNGQYLIKNKKRF